MVALELRAGAAFDPAAFDAFLVGQPDLGPKWLPSFIRVTEELPKLASMKLDKRRLRREAWHAGTVFWRPAKDQRLRPLGDADRARLDPLLGREKPHP
jgi:fatty-acyl-CoA synthase